ncbi:cysteine desulfurase/selenocysteine lyase [Mucilaginibacter frigoritolerans]|uniref:cysteine desulfurase n=1 Tax=Mucilaginibacter frigoritolerans TaxID=652788 RepID=A0A562TVJ0_9SPHI|nr:family 2A encapsulin nanocompartment cargo protein cysteine desulfurase [Mucilaginibacter frigoritolerans]TWI97567.1 cysteine desulfurase/selenocysteine lyase [Mucilaginibacter frigoritolerans]
MSTNINEDSLPNLLELEKLANQFFKALPGSADPIAQTEPIKEYNPVGDYAGGIPGANGFPIALFGNNPQPPSLAGVGASPSAVNQGNVINLNEPQTSFEDPAVQPSHLSNGNNVPATPFSGNGLSLNNLNGLPYLQDHSFEKELQDTLNKINTAPAVPQLPFGSAQQVSDPSYYFLKTIPPQFSAPKSSGASGIINPPFDVNIIRQDFPILKERVNGKQLVWLDNAATTQKPKQVIDRISYFYEHENSNIHRAAHELAARATDAYEGARKKVQNFLNAASVNEIVFVRGATEAINLVAKSWGEQNLQAGDEIIVSHLEHHANIVPWQQLASKKNLKIRVIPVDDDGQLIIEEYTKLLGPKTKLVSFTQVSNALGTVTPAEQIVRLGHLAGAKVLVDGAQSVSHMPVDVQALDADWFVFSGHKVFAPTGIGVLYGKEDLLNETQPWQGGGNMIVDVTFEHTQYHNAPARFEAGTGNIADAVGLGAAIDYVSRIGMEKISTYEHYLLIYATQLLKEVPGLRLIGTAANKASVLSFVLEGYKTEEVGHELNKQGIAVRSGHHCAQPILRRFGVESTVRPSLAFYNTCAEVDLLVETLHRLKK